MPDDARAQLESDHPRYAHFAESYIEQDRWLPQAHRMYWRAAIHLWPPRRGRRSTSGIYARALAAAAEQLDWSIEDAAAALKLSLESLRRGSGLADARKLVSERRELPPGLLKVSVTDYALPRIWAPMIDQPPDPDAYDSLGGGSGDPGPLVAQLAASLAAL